MDNKIVICKRRNDDDKYYRDVWEYRIYIKGVRECAISRWVYLSIEGARKAAVQVGRMIGCSVFDRTQRGRQIWPERL